MQYMTRTFTTTKATIAHVVTNGETSTIFPIGTILIVGDVDKTKALKVAKKQYSTIEDIIVTKVEAVTELRGMNTEVFYSNSILMKDARTPAEIPCTPAE